MFLLMVRAWADEGVEGTGSSLSGEPLLPGRPTGAGQGGGDPGIQERVH